MSALLPKIECISQWEKDLVYGYNRYDNEIPIDISNLCLLYYHEVEYFARAGKNSEPDLTFNEEKDTMTVKFSGGGTAYGFIDIIKSTEASWLIM